MRQRERKQERVVEMLEITCTTLNMIFHESWIKNHVFPNLFEGAGVEDTTKDWFRLVGRNKEPKTIVVENISWKISQLIYKVWEKKTKYFVKFLGTEEQLLHGIHGCFDHFAPKNTAVDNTRLDSNENMIGKKGFREK